MEDALFIGIDGGGTTCRARIADAAGNRLGEGLGGPANVRRELNVVLHSILTASRAAAEAAGLTEADLKRAHAGLGLAGAAVTDARELLRQTLEADSCFLTIDIGTDAYATWLGAYQGEDGAILIHGTGSCGLAVVKGELHYVSGYGSQISDEASAMMVGRELIRHALWAKDGRRQRTPLADWVLHCYHDNVEEIIQFADKAKPDQYGELAPKVFDYAERHDPLALELVAQVVSDATRMIDKLLERGAPSVYLHGGMAAPIASWLPESVRRNLAESMNQEDIPLEGALLMARLGCSEFPRPSLARQVGP